MQGAPLVVQGQQPTMLTARPPTPPGLTSDEWTEAHRLDALRVAERAARRSALEEQLRDNTGGRFAGYRLWRMDGYDSYIRQSLARREKDNAERARRNALRPKFVSVCNTSKVASEDVPWEVLMTAEALATKVLELFEQNHRRMSWREVQCALRPTLGLVAEGAARRAVTAARKRQRSATVPVVVPVL